MWTQEQVNKEIERIYGMEAHTNSIGIQASIAVSLLRIANAQEALYEASQIDLQQAIENEIQSRAETMANEMQESKTKRSFIGKKA